MRYLFSVILFSLCALPALAQPVPLPPPTPASAVRAAAADVAKLSPEAAKHTRFLWLGPGSAADKHVLYQVLSGHINSLSREPDIVRPAVVLASGVVADGLGLAETAWGQAVLLRVNIEDYGWDSKVYDGLAELDPYFHVTIEKSEVETVTETVYDEVDEKQKKHWPGGIYRKEDGGDGKFYPAGDYDVIVKKKVPRKTEKTVDKKAKQKTFAAAPWLAETPADKASIASLTNATQSNAPILGATDFLWQTGIQAERKVGYYGLQQIADQKSFDKLVGFSKKESKEFSRELLAAVANGGVSRQPRRIARFEKIGGGYLQTFDNELATDTANPLRTLNGGFTFLATEIFAHGSNGIFKLGLFNKDGVRQDSAPDVVGRDQTTHNNDGRIHIGLSCWRCHQADKTSNGVNDIKDWARNLLKRPLALQSADYDKLKQLRQNYLRSLEPFLDADRRRHALAMFDATGLTPFEWTAKLSKVWANYDQPVSRARAALELGVTEECLFQAIDAAVKSGQQLDSVATMFLRPAAEIEPLPLETFREEYAVFQLILRSVKH